MLVKVLRPYSGIEGRRVRSGTALFISDGTSEVPEGAIAVSPARYRELERVGLVEPGKLATEKGPKRPGRAAPPNKKPTNAIADTRRKLAPNTTAPGKDPTGIKIGRANALSSSVVVPASESVTSKPLRNTRGRRGERAGSPSTTPIESSTDQTSSTPPIEPGGESTEPKPGTGAEPPFE